MAQQNPQSTNIKSSISFQKVCEVFLEVEHISSRNTTTEILSNFYKQLNDEDAQILSYLILGRVAPSFVPAEFNYSEKSLIKLFQNYIKAINRKIDIANKRVETGDIGDTVYYVTEQLEFKSKDNTLKQIYDVLWSIIKTTGNTSIDRKNTLVFATLKELSPIEAKYFVRIICGELRTGINSRTLLDVFSFMISNDKGITEELRRAYGVCTDIGYICKCIKDSNESNAVENLQKIHLRPGIPVLARLVERVGSFQEVFDRFPMPILVQPKFDGLRCQIHKYKVENSSDDFASMPWKKYVEKEVVSTGLFDVPSTKDDVDVRLFTRNLEDVTDMFPEIVESAKHIPVESFVLDSEALGFNGKTFLSFQETMQRRRKNNVQSMQKEIPMKAMTFDILYLNGQDLIKEDTEKRIDILTNLKIKEKSIQQCTTDKVEDMDGLMEIFNKNVDAGNEGIIVKKREGQYCPGDRNYEWIKLKKSMMNSLVDTVDLVAIGYYFGSGRRADVGIGAVLGALYNEKNNSFEGICKVGTGLTDGLMHRMLDDFSKDKLNEKPKNVFVEDSLLPDVWVFPKIVFTVEADDVTKRISNNAGIGGGLSLRFPRLIEWGRDKAPEEATTVEELLHTKKL